MPASPTSCWPKAPAASAWPVRQQLLATGISRDEAAARLGLDPARRIVLIVGGSLGARTLNESVLSQLDLLRSRKDVQVYWQTGKYYSDEIRNRLQQAGQPDNLSVTDFIGDMGVAYAAADLVVSRAGAGSISEFCLLGKPVILVPSPNVAEDHQTKNAMALVERKAALFTADADARGQLLPLALDTVNDAPLLASLSENIRQMARPNAADDIADEVIRLAETGGNH